MIEIRNLRVDINKKNNKWLNYISEKSFTSISCPLFRDDNEDFYRIIIEDKDNRFSIDLYSIEDVHDCFDELKRLMVDHAQEPSKIHTLDLGKYRSS